MTLSLLYVYIRTPDLGRFLALSLHRALHGVSFITENMKRRQIALKQVGLVGVTVSYTHLTLPAKRIV